MQNYSVLQVARLCVCKWPMRRAEVKEATRRALSVRGDVTIFQQQLAGWLTAWLVGRLVGRLVGSAVKAEFRF